MPQQVTLFIDDLTLPAMARRVLERQLQRHARFDYQLHFLSQLETAVAWDGLATSAAQSLTQLLQQLIKATEPFVWLHGTVLITADLPDPFAGQAVSLQPDLRLALQSVLLFDSRAAGAAALQAQAQTLLKGSFHAAADAVLNGANLPSSWQPGAWHDIRRGGLADLRPFTARPWLNAQAATAPLWEGDLAALLQSDPSLHGVLRQECATGQLRSSLQYQFKHNTLAHAVPPAEVRVLDAVLPHAEITVPSWRLEQLQTIRYAAPRLLSSPARPREIPLQDWVRAGRVFPRRKQRQENKQIVLGMLLRGTWTERRTAAWLIIRYIWLRRPRTFAQFLQTPARLASLSHRVGRKLTRGSPRYKAVRRLVKQGYHVGKYGVQNPRRVVARILDPRRRHG